VPAAELKGQMPELVKDWVLAEADSVANVNTEEAF